MQKLSKIFVAGHRGMVGSAIVRKLENEGYSNLILRTSSELDLRNQNEVEKSSSQKTLNTYFWRRRKSEEF